MLARFTDFDTTFSVLDELRRRADRAWDDFDSFEDRRVSSHAASAWPKFFAKDTGAGLTLEADVPGLTEKDITVTLTGATLTATGERKLALPEGYSLQRQERASAKFSRTWTLPYEVVGDQTTATVKDGVLSITLTKVPEAQPRQIAVRASA